MLGAALLASPAAAQEITTAHAEVGRCYEMKIDPKTKLHGFSATHFLAFRSQVARIIDPFEMPEVNPSPAPIAACLAASDVFDHRALAAIVR